MKKNRQNSNRIKPILWVLVSFAAVVAIGMFSGAFGAADYAISEKEGANRGNPELPVFSVESGFYEEPFDLEITAPEGYEVYYTLDGSTPTRQSIHYENPIYVYNRSAEPNVYRSISHVIQEYNEKWTEPETVDKCFVVRAVAVDEKGNGSDVVTASYFVGLDAYKDKTVVSLVADPDDLFGENGIYVTGAAYDEWYEGGQEGNAPPVNYNRRGKEWRRDANLECIINGQSTLNQQARIQIQGSGSRWSALKRFRISAGKMLSDETFATGLFAYPVSTLSTREGYNDHVCQSIAKDRAFLSLQCEPINLFLNGELWQKNGCYLYEMYTAKNISRKLGIEKVAVVKDGEADSDAESGENPYSNVHGYIETHDLKDPASYEEYGNIIDIQSYIDYTCLQNYMVNLDYSENHNTVIWHSIEREDAEWADMRWRWGLHDMDLDWYRYFEPYMADTFREVGDPKYPPITQHPIYSALRVNDDFCKQFVLTYMDLINTNFKLENVEPILASTGGSAEEVEEARTFFENRPPYAMKYLAQEFDLTGEAQTVTLTVNDPAGGTVQLNTITPELKDNSWSGLYFTDYPITLTATANEGYRFAGWEIGGEMLTAETVEVAVQQGGTDICAIFEPIT